MLEGVLRKYGICVSESYILQYVNRWSWNDDPTPSSITLAICNSYLPFSPIEYWTINSLLDNYINASYSDLISNLVARLGDTNYLGTSMVYALTYFGADLDLYHSLNLNSDELLDVLREEIGLYNLQELPIPLQIFYDVALLYT